MYSQLPMYQRQGKVAFKKDLGNIVLLTEAMGSPEKSFSSIHVGGTNGKGSVSHMMAAGLQANGLKVGMYTSPHYIDFRERIKINGQFISEEEVVNHIQRWKPLYEDVKPSFFEMTVAMAFSYFAEQKVDVAIIEVGLGGRLDSTNIITPLLSVITNISYDHQAMLGNTLPLIAGEKAGIIKSNIPAVIGEYQEEVASVFDQKANEVDTNLEYAQKCTFWEEDSLHVKGSDWHISVPVAFQSGYQRLNIQTALYSLFKLKTHFDLSSAVIEKGINEISRLTYYVGRLQTLQTTPLTIADSAHNVAGIQALLRHIESLSYDHLHIVIGMVKDKDVSEVLQLLPAEAHYYIAKANIPRGLPADELLHIASSVGLNGKSFSSVADAYMRAITVADENDLVLVLGSIFVVAEVLSHSHPL